MSTGINVSLLASGYSNLILNGLDLLNHVCMWCNRKFMHAKSYVTSQLWGDLLRVSGALYHYGLPIIVEWKILFK